jgi:hypothetical protein
VLSRYGGFCFWVLATYDMARVGVSGPRYIGSKALIVSGRGRAVVRGRQRLDLVQDLGRQLSRMGDGKATSWRLDFTHTNGMGLAFTRF